MVWAKTTAKEHKKHLNFEIWCDLYWRFYGSITGSVPCQDAIMKFDHAVWWLNIVGQIYDSWTLIC